MALLWAIGGLTAWLTSFVAFEDWSVSGSLLMLLAVSAALTSLLLRLPILSSPPCTSVGDDHMVWLLCCFAAINWLGFFLYQCSSWLDAIPVILAILSAEVWFVAAAWRVGGLPWLWEAVGAWSRPTTKVGAKSLATSVAHEQEALDDNLKSRTLEGFDESGHRYLSGQLRVCLEAGQPTATVVVGFCPAFKGDPQVDLECEADDIAVKLINCTVTGMRIAVNRQNVADATVFLLQWYAVEVELELSDSVPVRHVLP